MGWAAVMILAGADARGGPVERLARVFSPEFRRIEKRLAELDRELDRLPLLAPRPFASRYGFRSEDLVSQEEPHWLQIDLQQRRKIDRIVAVPAHIPVLGERGAGYGLPKRFQIEVSDDPEMNHSTIVVDRTSADVANPGRYPEDFRIEPTTGRYVRFTSTRHFSLNGSFFWALEELIVLSGSQSVATWQPVETSSSLELFPNWSRSRVQDGQSALGLPVSTDPSPSRGYLSAVTNDPEELKWLLVDLGSEHLIDEVRLVPVESDNFQMIGEGAFPRGWAVELSNDPEFETITWRFEMAKINLVGYPGDCAVVIPVSGKPGRFLRLVTRALWGVDWSCGYGLAEIQAYAGDQNVAFGKAVTASDAAENIPGSTPACATDGFSSRHRLVELPEFLDLIGRRGGLERERDRLLERSGHKVRMTGLVLGYGGGGLAAVFALGSAVVLVRQRTIRGRAVAQLREQIARDLHDDIGSNLGGIVLLSEMGSRHSADDQAREDFAAIKEAAEKTSQSMQDIVWLIGRGNMGLRDLVARMRQSAQAIVGDKEVSLVVEPADFRDRELSLLLRRHVFFAFKETLNNVRRHAAANSVEVRITIDHSHLTFSIRDDGAGFDPSKAMQAGHGLTNLSRRAQRLKGRCRVESRPGGGTLVDFKAPLKS